jgi:hypothetical protein
MARQFSPIMLPARVPTMPPRRDFAVALASMAVRAFFGAVVKQQFDHAFDSSIRNESAGSRPREQALLYLDALGLGMVFSQADPSDFGICVGDVRDKAGVETGSCQFFVTLLLGCNTCGNSSRVVTGGHCLAQQGHRLRDLEPPHLAFRLQR